MSSNNYGPPEIVDLQSVFDKVVTHLFTQRRPAQRIHEDGSPACMYRSPEGDACAVGCLIDDEDYTDRFENVGIEGLIASPGRAEIFPEEMRDGPILELLKDLQVIHDNAALEANGRFATNQLQGHLYRVADRFGLSSKCIHDACFPINMEAFPSAAEV